MTMEDLIRSIYWERASHPSTLGILLVEKGQFALTPYDVIQTVLLEIVERGEKEMDIVHFSDGRRQIGLMTIDKETIRDWLFFGKNKKIINWIYSGKILFERNDFFHHLIKELQDFPFNDRKIRIGLEFCKLISSYLDGKRLYQKKNHLDAFNHVIRALHHLARLSIIEKGMHPELTVWDQMKQIDPEIFKLYEEFIRSEEPLEKRLELLFLASEYMIRSKTELGAAHIADILKQKAFWSVQELFEHPELKIYSIDLLILLEYLLDREYIELIVDEKKGKGGVPLALYRLKKDVF
jgi:hypothetical protein